ncbi:carbohydrate kinase family protein [Cloacibacillus sp. An23]|uniref:carbohydrate kinase family protein n=1 Tax=Cloacibacillus sp. An23 TaxID=1965591 RepID=UPI000B39D41C|nr:carbohydrate kinase family protein [Cloacibacillus sp. An23]OUO94699.1 sugar kinase [Cloacibacillus sp. An23]
MSCTAVFGTVFMDCKGFAANRYDPLGRNVGSVRFIHGGVGRNVAENLALTGASPVFVSSVDEGPLGEDVLSRLSAEGVDVSRVRRAPSSGMGIWLAVMDERGELASSISQMPDLSIMERIVAEEGDEIIRAADNVILELDLNDYISSEALRLARKYSKRVYGITGNMEVVLRNRHFLRELECYICNETEAGRLFEAPVPACEPERVLEMLEGYVEENGLRAMVVTLGGGGSVFYEGASHDGGFCPAVPTDVVDTSGAGDAYFSGTVEAMIRGVPLREAVAFGTRLASWTIREEGPTCRALPEPLFL